MATHVERLVGRPPKLVLADHVRVRPISVAAPDAPPMAAPPPREREAPQHYPSDMGVFESARMSRELGREMPLNSLQRQKSPNPVLSALMNMSTRRFWALVAGVTLVVLGLIALRFPVFLPAFDQWGFRINCGSGFHGALTQAGAADSSGVQFVDQCHTAIAMRRAWSIPVVVFGALLLGALMVTPPRPNPADAQPESVDAI
jgi:hypothetical protein